MRRSSLTARLLTCLLTVLLIVLVTVLGLAPTARAASGVCDPTGKLCVSSVTFSPATVNNSADTVVTVTARATSGYLYLGTTLPDQVVGPAGLAQGGRLNAVLGSSGTYRGTITVVRGAAPGTFSLRGFYPTLTVVGGLPPSIGEDAVAASDLARITVTGTAADTDPPTVSSFTAGTGSYDATRGGTVPVSVRVTDAGSGTSGVSVLAYAAADDPRAGTTKGVSNTTVQLKLTSGTSQDGVWSGALPLLGGTAQGWEYAITAGDRFAQFGYVDTAGLRARGLPATFRTTTSAVPGTPVGVRVSTNADLLGGAWVAVGDWNRPSTGSVQASSWLVTPSGSCAQPAFVVPDNRALVTRTGSSGGICTLKVQARNAAGTSSGSASGSAVLP